MRITTYKKYEKEKKYTKNVDVTISKKHFLYHLKKTNHMECPTIIFEKHFFLPYNSYIMSIYINYEKPRITTYKKHEKQKNSNKKNCYKM
jgi:hypothetical protein